MWGKYYVLYRELFLLKRRVYPWLHLFLSQWWLTGVQARSLWRHFPLGIFLFSLVTWILLNIIFQNVSISFTYFENLLRHVLPFLDDLNTNITWVSYFTPRHLIWFSDSKAPTHSSCIQSVISRCIHQPWPLYIL